LRKGERLTPRDASINVDVDSVCICVHVCVENTEGQEEYDDDDFDEIDEEIEEVEDETIDDPSASMESNRSGVDHFVDRSANVDEIRKLDHVEDVGGDDGDDDYDFLKSDEDVLKSDDDDLGFGNDDTF
jgi:hypothetical protein